MNRFGRALTKTGRVGLSLNRLTAPASSIIPQVLTTNEYHDQAGFKSGSGSKLNYASMLAGVCGLAGKISDVNYSILALIWSIEGYGYYCINYKSKAYCEQQEADIEAGQVISSLPFYTEEEVAKHNKDAETIWISYKNGVYDITEFVASHPGI